ncbi:MAG: hypothetical protein KDB14_13770, partial [Planctomycetales bacterium]|nr:hypothetical protein [Planctomycetales bacterium]
QGSPAMEARLVHRASQGSPAMEARLVHRASQGSPAMEARLVQSARLGGRFLNSNGCSGEVPGDLCEARGRLGTACGKEAN